MSLTDKQRLFVEYYLIEFNATKAAIMAGYSQKTAYSIGWENLRKPEIAERISQRLSETAMTADEVLSRLGAIARGDIGEFAYVTTVKDLHEHPSSRLVRKIRTRARKTADGDIIMRVEVELYDALAALIQLGKHHGILTERFEHSGPEGKPIEIVEVTRGE